MFPAKVLRENNAYGTQMGVNVWRIIGIYIATRIQYLYWPKLCKYRRVAAIPKRMMTVCLHWL